MPADNADVGVDLAGDNIDEGGDCDCGRLCNRALPALVHGGAEAGAEGGAVRAGRAAAACAWCRVATIGAAHVAVRRAMFDAPDGDPTDDSGNGRLYYVRLRFYSGGRAGRGSWG